MITFIKHALAAHKERKRQARIADRVNRWMTREEAGQFQGGTHS